LPAPFGPISATRSGPWTVHDRSPSPIVAIRRPAATPGSGRSMHRLVVADAAFGGVEHRRASASLSRRLDAQPPRRRLRGTRFFSPG
jgi:hypothetical protein